VAGGAGLVARETAVFLLAMCSGLVENEKQLLTLAGQARFSPLEMASGATDLVNEAATGKISGGEERYSNTDLPVFAANMEAAMAVVNLLRPYLQHKDPGALAQIKQRNDAVTSLLAHYEAHPGYDETGYVDYSTVNRAERRQLSTAVNALAEAMSKHAPRPFGRNRETSAAAVTIRRPASPAVPPRALSGHGIMESL
jgi:iron uptake system component EfeO